MTLNPKFAGQLLSFATKERSPAQPLHTLELFLDYVCPFSKKIFDTLDNDVLPVVAQKYPNKVQFIFRQQIQPWHPSSTLVHEAGAAILQTHPDQFWKFSKALFAAQTDFFDENVVREARNDTYRRLAKLAASVDAGINEKEIYELLEIGDRPGKDGSLNGGNKVTNDVKLMVKANRLQGVHVTPTVLFNGIVENGISSSFSKQDWEGWLEKNIA